MTLHQAIIKILSDKPGNIASIETIAEEINDKRLYLRRDKQPLPPYQIMMRVKLSNSRYSNLFQWIDKDLVKLNVLNND